MQGAADGRVDDGEAQAAAKTSEGGGLVGRQLAAKLLLIDSARSSIHCRPAAAPEERRDECADDDTAIALAGDAGATTATTGDAAAAIGVNSAPSLSGSMKMCK